MVDPICDPCGEEKDAGLSNDAMRLMFSCVVNTVTGSMSVRDCGLFKFWLISNVEPEARYQDTDNKQGRSTELNLCG